MKKFISIMAAIILVFALVPLCAEAAGGTATMSSASASAGDTVKLTVKLSGISGVKTGSIELTNVPAGIEVSEGAWLGDTWIANFDKENFRGVFAFEEALGDADVDIFTLTVKVTDKAAAGENRIGFKMQFQNDGGDWITDFENGGGVITVKAAASSDSDPDPKEDEPEGGTSDEPEDGAPDEPEGGTSDEPEDGAPDEPEGGDGEPKGDAQTDPAEDGSKNLPTNAPVDGKLESKGLSPLAIVLICVGAAVVVAAVVIIVLASKKKAK